MSISFTLARLCPDLPIFILAKKRLPSEFVKLYAGMITSPARIADMATAWRKARHRTACLLSCWGKRPVTAAVKVGQCTSLTQTREIWEPMPSLAEAWESLPARRSRPSDRERNGSRLAFLAKEHWDKVFSMK